MFSQIHDLLNATTTMKILILKQEDGTLSVTAEPIPSQGKMPMFAPLVVSGTPEELNEGFAAILADHTNGRASMIDQLEAVKAEMAESVKAATEKLKNPKKKTGGAAKASTGEPGELEEESEEVREAFSSAGVTSKTTPIKTANGKSGPAQSSIDLFD